ncbi:MAG TPA: hypothetical protein VEW46_16025 [Pyrinomonadaceae bacterium]|nr:hypothetical protein [Pyrinomonadaceae bacterium]
MKSSRRIGFKATAIFLAFALVQLSLQLSFAAPSSSSSTAFPQGILGRITTTGSGPATINGNNAASGDTVLPGSMLETPSGTEATIDLGPLGSVTLHSATRIRLDYACPNASSPDPQSCRVYVTLFAGCVTTNYKQGSHHRIAIDSKGLIEQSDSDKERSGGGALKTCSDASPAGVAGASSGGLGSKLWAALALGILAAPVAYLLITEEDNPSPSTP